MDNQNNMKTIKIYCFQYDVNKNKVFRQEYDAGEESYTKYGYDLLDPDNHEYYFHIRKDDMEAVQVHNDYKDNKIVYIYSITDDVNLALDKINEAFESGIQLTEKKLDELRKIYLSFHDERDRIKNEYPNGCKDSNAIDEHVR